MINNLQNTFIRCIASTLIMAFMILGLVGCSNAANLTDRVNRTADEPRTDSPMPGGWSNSRAPFANEREIFNIAMEGFDDLEYEPFLVTSQTIGGGFNYTFIAISVPAEPDAEIITIRVHLFNSAIGSDINPELKEVWLVEPADNGRFNDITKLYPVTANGDSGDEPSVVQSTPETVENTQEPTPEPTPDNPLAVYNRDGISLYYGMPKSEAEFILGQGEVTRFDSLIEYENGAVNILYREDTVVKIIVFYGGWQTSDGVEVNRTTTYELHQLYDFFEVFDRVHYILNFDQNLELITTNEAAPEWEYRVVFGPLSLGIEGRDIVEEIFIGDRMALLSMR